ncbi:PREDICTED: protein TIFY 11B-like isoform X2 [Camelina sativa]|nr:PREDICTED: protein TIFY 11B-like isoform X2 [Camelina sativa]
MILLYNLHMSKTRHSILLFFCNPLHLFFFFTCNPYEESLIFLLLLVISIISMSSTGQAPEKSNFSQRCSLLSRYLKEKGSFGNINMGLARKSDLELAGNFDLKGQQDVIKKAETSGTRSFDLIQKLSKGEASTSSGGKAIDIIDLSEPEPGYSQLTIFFGGKVMVFNEFPEDKAKEIMQVAAKEANHVAHVESKNTQNGMNLDMDMSISSKSNVIIPDLNEPTSSGNNEDQQTEQQQHQGVERIARRASLHRFFAKRKDR